MGRVCVWGKLGCAREASATEVPGSGLPGVPEGFTYAAPASPGFDTASMLLSEHSAGEVAA